MRSEDETTLEEIDEEMVSRALLLMKFYHVNKPMKCLLEALADFDEGKRTFIRLDGQTIEFSERDDIVKCLLAGEEYLCILQDKKDEEKKKRAVEKTEEMEQTRLDMGSQS